MLKISFILILIATITESEINVMPDEIQDYPQMLKLLNALIEYSDKCIFIVNDLRNSNHSTWSNGFGYDENITSNIAPVVTISYDFLLKKRFDFDQICLCKKYVIWTSNRTILHEIFQGSQNDRLFYPFTKIIIIFMNDHLRGPEFIFTNQLVRYIYVNALHVFWTKWPSKMIESKLLNILTNQTITYERNNIDENKMRTFLYQETHPLFDNNLYQNEINVSLFNCPPFVISLPSVKGKPRFDGVEYRFLQEITKNWRVNYQIRDFSDKISDPWGQVLTDLRNYDSNMAMCSVWMSEVHYIEFDLSKYFDSQCTTFLVPRPKIITQASSIYLPLSGEVWGTYLLSLILTGFLLNMLVVTRNKIYRNRYDEVYEKDNKKRTNEFTELSTTFVEIINVATAHGVTRFPTKGPSKILLTSFLIISLLIATAYSTGYTSLLTSPRFSKPIDTVADFVEQGIYWGELGNSKGLIKELRKTENKYYIELANRMKQERDLDERLERLSAGNYGRFVKVLSHNYVTDTETFSEYANSLRLMKDCLYKYYSVFAFVKNSPYTEYINNEIGKYLESGIIQFWFGEMNIKHGQSYIHSFFDQHINRSSEPTQLTIENLIGAFYLLLIGLGISIILFIIEILLKRK